jgi:hypothetical protein
MAQVSRRQFLKASIKASVKGGLAMCAFSAANGCAPTQGNKIRLENLKKQNICDMSYIAVDSNQLLIVPGLPDPVHNIIVFYRTVSNIPGNDPKQNVIEDFILNGAATDRETNDNAGGVGKGRHGLFVTKDEAGRDKGDHYIVDIYAGSYEEVARKKLIALDAACYLNECNFRYNIFSQNSNSIVYTLLRAMGLDVPDKSRALFMMPGNKRLLLPEGWRSYYEDWKIPKEIKEEDRKEFLEWYIQEMAKRVMAVKERNYDTEPDPERPYFFDPKKPFVRYIPLVIYDCVKTWEKDKGKKISKNVLDVSPSTSQPASQPVEAAP